MAFLDSISKFYFSKSNRWFKVLLILLFLWILVTTLKKYYPSLKKEGFSQMEKYSLKRNDAIYDSFYIDIYDLLNKTLERNKFELDQFINITQPDKNNSVMLDIGCGTGAFVNELGIRGYRAFGIDKSIAMVEHGKKKFPKNMAKLGDALEPMQFDKSVFTHIFCLGNTIYEIRDKTQLLRNANHWLAPGGYFIVHLVNPHKYNPIIMAGKPVNLDDPQMLAMKRITDTEIDFVDFKYRSEYDFKKLDKGVVYRTETFIDSGTEAIRQQESTLYMESESAILAKAGVCGFNVEGQVTFESYSDDKYQSIYILRKITNV